jgi:hypothetical protein
LVIDRMAENVERREAEAQASYVSMTSSVEYEFDLLKKAYNRSAVDDPYRN